MRDRPTATSSPGLLHKARSLHYGNSSLKHTSSMLRPRNGYASTGKVSSRRSLPRPSSVCRAPQHLDIRFFLFQIYHTGL